MSREDVKPRDEGRHAAELLELGDAFFELDSAWRIVRVNCRQELLSRKPRSETVGRTFAQVWPELADEGSRYWREYRRCMVERVPVQFEEYYAPLRLWTGVTAYPVSGGGIAVFFRDVTAQRQAQADARARTAEYRTLAENAPEAIARFDRRLRHTYVNGYGARVHGLVPAEIVGKTMADLGVPPATAASWNRHLQEVLATGEHRTVELELEGPTLGWRSFSCLLVPERDDRGELASVLAITRDVTEQRSAKQALERSEQRLRAIFEGAAVGIVEVDEEDRFVAVNGRFCAMLGYRREELLGKRPHDITAPEDLARTEALNAKGHTGELDVFDYEKRYLRRDGTPIWVHVTVSVVRDPAGRFVRAVGTAEDVTERRRAREALRASEERWNAAIENFSEGAIIATEDEQVIYWNPAARALHGFATDREGLGPLARTPETFELWTPDGSRLLPLDAWPMRRLKRGEPVRRLELRLRRPDQGWERTVSYSGAMLQTSAGERLIFLSVTDLTEQRRAERALREADRRKDEFLGMLSHELRNPLAPIRNALYILDHAPPEGQKAQRARDIANRQVAHLTRLVDDLLDVTRIARGKIELRREEVDLADLVRRTAEDYRSLMQDRGLELAVRLPGVAVRVDGDPARLTQVLGNLLSNAAKFTPVGGQVTLALDVDAAANAVVRVKDTGAGVEPALVPVMFEPFTQGTQTLARSEGGLGLGLALVRGLVALHGGTVAAVSGGPGQGTEFTVILPPSATTGRDAARRGDEEPRGGAAPRRVLVVEDDDAADTLAQHRPGSRSS